MIQTYDPEHFAVQTAKDQDYEAFYRQEIMYRTMLSYPPVWNLLLVQCQGEKEDEVALAAEKMSQFLKMQIAVIEKSVMLVGPADASIAKISDVYRKVIYMKTKEYGTLVALKDKMEHVVKDDGAFSNVSVQYDFNPTSGF